MPKKAKQYVYVKECKPMTRQACDIWEKKKLRPTCDKIQKTVRSYKPLQAVQGGEKGLGECLCRRKEGDCR